VDDPFKVGFIEDLFAFGHAEQEGVAAEVVDLAGDALGVVIDGGDETVAEELVGGAGDAEMMFDVSEGLLEVKGAEVVADGDALVEGLVRGEAEELGQVRLAEQNQGEQGGGVHVIVEEEAELVEDVWGQAMGFIEDEQEITALASQVGEGGVELG